MNYLSRNGVCYNLKQSPYVYKNGELSLYFSSKLNLDKFIDRKDKFIDEFNYKLSSRYGIEVNFFLFPLLTLYINIEKRGFYAKIEERELKEWQVRLGGEKVMKND